MRQLTDASGAVTLTKGYEPYGEVLYSQGSSTSRYGYTGEWLDETGLMNFRARYYSSDQGRFINRDIWSGNNKLPISYNKWGYGYANPTNRTDPSGMCPDDDGDGKCDPGWWCDKISDPEKRLICYRTYKCSDTVDPTTIPLPGINDIPAGGFSEYWREETIKKYSEIRKAVYGQNDQYVDKNGKIKDEVLAALIISVEFGSLKCNIKYPDFFPEAKEALSNQYDSGRKIGYSNPGPMLCYGECSIEAQISWLYTMEAIRNDGLVVNEIISGHWISILTEGKSVVGGGYVYNKNTSWFWGNVASKEELAKYFLVVSYYAPEINGAFPYMLVYSGKK